MKANDIYERLKVFIKRHRPLYAMSYPLRLTIAHIKGRSIAKAHREFEICYESMIGNVESGTVLVRAPDFMGSFEMDLRSHIFKRLIKSNRYETELAKLVKSSIDGGKDAIDVGANIGLFTVLLSKLISKGNRVLSIEPVPSVQAYLRRNIQRNACDESVIPYQGIAVDKPGDYLLNVVPGLEEYSSVGSLVHPSIVGKTSEVITVRGDTIDNLVAELSLCPGFIKVDTEGAEFQVLNGALHTIKTHQPIMLLELSAGMMEKLDASPQMVIQLLNDIGYEVSDAYRPGTPLAVPFEGEIFAVPKAVNGK